MFTETIDYFAESAVKKARMLSRNPAGFFVGAMMAGVYVGFGIILIFILGSYADEAYRKLIMGCSFGIALTLVVFAGSELFTGHTMYMTIGWLRRAHSFATLLKVWLVVWLGNLTGSAMLGVLFFMAGAAGLVSDSSSFFYHMADSKMNAPIVELVAKGILCNWLVCLSMWVAGRTQDDVVKCIVIFWCLFAFIASGFEHSVANMTLFSIALLGNHPESISLYGMGYNLFWVTLGNIIAGSVFMAAGYSLYNGNEPQERAPASPIEMPSDMLAKVANQGK